MPKRAIVPDDYYCPFCPTHRDDTFYTIRLIEQPICEGCMFELGFFSDEEELREDPLIIAVEQYLRLPWRACQCMLLHDQKQHWLFMRQAPPIWFMEATSETPACTEAEAKCKIDAFIQEIDRLVQLFKQSLPPEVLRRVDSYCIPYDVTPYRNS